MHLRVVQDSCMPGKKAAYFPPKLEVLMAWAALFRSCDTFRNYYNYVRTACFLVKQPVEVCTQLINRVFLIVRAELFSVAGCQSSSAEENAIDNPQRRGLREKAEAMGAAVSAPSGRLLSGTGSDV